MKFDPGLLTLYAITDGLDNSTEQLLSKAEKALAGGVTMLQLRDKKEDTEYRVKRATELVRLCHRYGVPLIINDDPEAAIQSGADGVHVGAHDMTVPEIRRRYGNDLIVGATAKTVEQAKKACLDGADYLGVGAVFPSPTKTDAIRVTKDLLALICRTSDIPCVAIGGITEENMPELRGAGMKGFAVVSAIFGQEDIFNAARRLREKADIILSPV